jgi:hypothetical protein
VKGKIGEVRNSQLISTFGPGAILDLPDMSVIIAGLDHWDIKQCSPISEPRLVRKLGIKKIYSPPSLQGSNDTKQGSLPAYRFPRYLVCPKCRKLSTVRGFYKKDNDETVYCLCNREEGGTKVFPARFIVACAAGHIDDFPWDFYVHKDQKRKTEDCKNKLVLNDHGSTGSIADVEVECKGCGQKRALDEAFSGKGLGKCLGHRNWHGPWDTEDCNQQQRALLRGASNLYFPVVVSALSIPPFTSSDPIYDEVAAVLDRWAKIDSIEKLELALDTGFFDEFKSRPLEEIWKAVTTLRSLGDGVEQDLYFPEWQALIHGVSMDAKHEFQTEEQEVPERYQEYISKVVMVRRLKEIRVLDGFSRIEAIPDTIERADSETSQASFKAYLSKRELGWRPGIETKGEGIFFKLDEEKLRAWEERFQDNAHLIQEEFRKYCEDRNMDYKGGPDPRYILLHTLSHALMRQLCLDSGYSSTSLRERIYSRNEPGQSMAGILIYTATPDSEGSLGGLVELGRKERFEELLWHALQESRFCSGDPLCSEHKPNAIGDLNGAACHACQLSPETSCESSNRFLDRSFLVPTVSETGLAYFD